MYNLKLIKNILSTAILSDVLDECGIDGMLSNTFTPNFFEAKLCGYAVTLPITAMEKSDDVDGIYKGLEIFEYVNPGNVIIVANPFNEFAYWGELNTSLALRAGATGTVVSSVTRDNRKTVDMCYPVFSKGRYAKDIKTRGTVREVNVPVKVDDILINPGDLVFADIDGVIVIRRDMEDKVLKRALFILENEINIISNIAKDVPAKDLVKKHGYF